MKIQESEFERLKAIFIAIIVGFSLFYLIVGLDSLWVRNISWLQEGDQLTHYFGWQFYRNSPWSFPIGLNPAYGGNITNTIVYTDSIPLIAIPLKLLTQYLPIQFQYFGIWNLVCFCGVAYFSFRIMQSKGYGFLIQLLVAGLLMFSPPMLFRIGWHAALISHFLILGSIYLLIQRNSVKGSLVRWIILLLLSVLTQPYIFALVYLLWLSQFINQWILRSIKWKVFAVEFIFANLVIFIFAWQAGYFSVSLSTATTIQYGGFGSNVLTFFNANGWSRILGNLYETGGNWEDINYLGLGNIFLIFVAIYKFSALKSAFSKIIQEFPGTLILFFGLAIFSFTNNVGIGNLHFTYPLSEEIIKVFGVFRNSARMLWPVYYGIILFLIIFIAKNFSKNHTVLFLCIAFILQSVDTSAGWLPVRQKIEVLTKEKDVPSKYTAMLDQPFWVSAAEKYKNIYLLPLRNDHPQYFNEDEIVNWPLFASYASLKGLKTNSVYLARANSSAIFSANKSYEQMMFSGQYDPETLYIVSNDKVIPVLLSLDKNRDLFAKINGVNVLAPNWLTCNQCIQVDPTFIIANEIPITFVGSSIKFGRGGQGLSYLRNVQQYEKIGYGWAYPEAWGVWSEGRKAKIVMPIPTGQFKTLRLTLKALISKDYPSQNIMISVDGQSAHPFNLESEINLIDISLLDRDRKYVSLEFFLPTAISPKKIGLGSDTRKLAIGLIEITFINE